MSTTYDIAPVLLYYGVQPHDRAEGATNCPIHQDDRPSCSVNNDMGVFYCHACGAKGTALDIVQAREGLDREAAARFLAEVVGVSGIQVHDSPDGKPGRRVPPGTGYRPAATRRRAPAGVRGRPHPWS